MKERYRPCTGQAVWASTVTRQSRPTHGLIIGRHGVYFQGCSSAFDIISVMSRSWSQLLHKLAPPPAFRLLQRPVSKLCQNSPEDNPTTVDYSIGVTGHTKRFLVADPRLRDMQTQCKGLSSNRFTTLSLTAGCGTFQPRTTVCMLISECSHRH